ncbi:MAG: alpha-hydroxy-acid oxidizing enzyme [Verrucomicrobia bacterium]|nr:MAG: alpha-hydroxy-acid oxidizing enzyme [Verrucomicrobiota bacterium]
MLGASLLPPLTAEQAPDLPGKARRKIDFSSEAVSLSDFEELARRRMAHMAYELIAGGAADELTVRWNREALDQVRLRPRVLMDVSDVNTRTNLFGHDLTFPILLAPTSFHRIYHPEGELATARGASAGGAVYVVSSATTTLIEDIARVSTQPLWFQMYVQHDREFSRDVIKQAVVAGCRALCVTVDTPVLGARNRQQRAKVTMPPGLKTPYLSDLNAGRGTLNEQKNYTMTWKDIDWVLSVARVPVLLKGILNPDDAERAVKTGVAGLIVSNHGGRNLDTLPATITALPAITKRVGDRVPILMDGGIRRGTDVLKAFALGAKAVLIGRPYLYGLGLAGSEGVTQVLKILRNELEMAMALTGRPNLASIDPSLIW